tara:strand:+ start:1257 stop:1421 length:165 start_codon:yes stop_codon:yes gene_type:complete
LPSPLPKDGPDTESAESKFWPNDGPDEVAKEKVLYASKGDEQTVKNHPKQNFPM